MTPMRLHSFKMEPEMALALKAIKQRDGIAESEQIRRGILLWLSSKGMRLEKTERKRADTRKRP
jgi:hypothetical protein